MSGKGTHFFCPVCAESKQKMGSKYARINNLIRKVCADCQVDERFYIQTGIKADATITDLETAMIEKKVSIRRLSIVAGVSEGTIFKAKHGRLINAFLAQCITDAIAKMAKNDKYYRAGFGPREKGRHV